MHSTTLWELELKILSWKFTVDVWTCIMTIFGISKLEKILTTIAINENNSGD